MVKGAVTPAFGFVQKSNMVHGGFVSFEIRFSYFLLSHIVWATDRCTSLIIKKALPSASCHRQWILLQEQQLQFRSYNHDLHQVWSDDLSGNQSAQKAKFLFKTNPDTFCAISFERFSVFYLSKYVLSQWRVSPRSSWWFGFRIRIIMVDLVVVGFDCAGRCVFTFYCLLLAWADRLLCADVLCVAPWCLFVLILLVVFWVHVFEFRGPN